MPCERRPDGISTCDTPDPARCPGLGRRDLVVTVCDRAHETLRPAVRIPQLHWSVLDPVASKDAAAFNTATDALDGRIHGLAALVRSANLVPRAPRASEQRVRTGIHA